MDEYPSLTDDLHCARCDYPLRGLDRSQDCPECGAAIETSLIARRMFRALTLQARPYRMAAWLMCGLGGMGIALCLLLALCNTRPGNPGLVYLAGGSLYFSALFSAGGIAAGSTFVALTPTAKVRAGLPLLIAIALLIASCWLLSLL